MVRDLQPVGASLKGSYRMGQAWFSVGYCTGFSIPQLEYSSYM